MYVAPRPKAEDDPLFAVRLALGVVFGLLAAILLQAQMPMLIPALTMGLMAGIRKGFDVRKAIGGPLAMIAIVILMSSLVSLTRPLPAILIVLIMACSSLTYYLILRTGNPLGMLVLIVTVLMSVMGMHSLSIMNIMRDGMIQASLVALIISPVLYALLPPRAKSPLVEVHTPAPGNQHGLQALIRGSILLMLIFWLYTVVDKSSVMLAVAAVFVLVFPTREQRFAEARERCFATVLGGALALLIVGVSAVIAHLGLLLVFMFLGALFLANRMIYGRHPPMVYQFALSVMITVVVSSLTTRAPVEMIFTRIILTLIGAMSAAFLTSLLESLLLKGSDTSPCETSHC